MIKLRAEGSYQELSKIMRKIRVEDLSLVDRADFLIASISAKTASWGTAEEVFWANRMKKPIFLVVSKAAAPARSGFSAHCPTIRFTTTWRTSLPTSKSWIPGKNRST